MSACNQCGKPAIFKFGGHPLCVECFDKVQRAWYLQYIALTQELNYLTDSIEATTGLQGVLPRYPTPQQSQKRNKIIFNNIKVDRSNIGVINTGEVQKIDVSMDRIKKFGNENLVNTLKQFTEEVISNQKLDSHIKNQILEQLSYITTQMSIPKEERKQGILKSVFSGIITLISGFDKLLNLWNKLKPLLEQYIF